MNVAILGAGVGGLSTAIALRHKGFTVDVYERHPSRSEIGAGIVCWPNASFVLHALGMLDDIATVSGSPLNMQRLSSQGEELGNLDILRLNERMGYPSFSILRKDLMQVLESHALRAGATIHYSHTVEQIEPLPDDSSQIHFVDGTLIHADLVIGADGRMNSAARAFVNGNNRPVYQGFINWIGVFQTTSPLFKEISVHDYWGVGERFGIVPVSPTKAYWAGAVAAPLASDMAPAGYKPDLLTLFEAWPEPIPTLIHQTPVADINKIYVHDHTPIDVWHKNNVLLIGDAAHAPLPTSGQGACQALEDAWQIAELLEQDCSNLARVFQEFTHKRLAKTTGITMAARHFAASLFNTDPDYCSQRNLGSKATDYHAVVEGMSNGWANGLPMGA